MRRIGLTRQLRPSWRWSTTRDPVGELAELGASDAQSPARASPARGTDGAAGVRGRGCAESWGAHESALSTARKNAKKSALAAILALGYLCGPLRRPGWRGAIASVSKEKAGELRRQVAEIADASNLDVRSVRLALSRRHRDPRRAHSTH